MALRRRRILLVHRNPAIMLEVQPRLTQQGYEVFATVELSESLRQVYQLQPDLIMLELQNSHEDRWSTLQNLRQLSDVPVILLFNSTDEADRIKGLELGANDCISQPFSAEEIVARVNAVMRAVERGLMQE